MLLVLIVLLLLLLVVVKEVKVLPLLEEPVTVDTVRLVEEPAITDVEMVVLRGSAPVVKGNVVGKPLDNAGENSKYLSIKSTITLRSLYLKCNTEKTS